MRDLASTVTNFPQKPCKLSLISPKLESIWKIKFSKYEIKLNLTVFQSAVVFVTVSDVFFFTYLKSFVSIDRYNLNSLANLCNNYIHVTNMCSSWAIYGLSKLKSSKDQRLVLVSFHYLQFLPPLAW